MDRILVYPGSIPQDTDLLKTNQDTMVALGLLAQAILGTSTVVDGLPCTPTTPASLSVLVGPGSIYSLESLEATAYGSLAADTTDQIVKQGIILGNTTANCPAPTTSGQSVVYLVQAQYEDVDSGSTVLPYYNAANPAVPYSGPSNSGVSQNTVRKGVCLLNLKAGVAATTGSQATPAPDAGYVGLYAITVANGQSTITSGNIQQLSTAPFIGAKLPSMLTSIQQSKPNYALDTSSSANTIAVALSPAPQALTDGMPIRVKVANSSTGATVMSIPNIGNVACKTTSGADFVSNTVVANGIYTFVYDANGNRLQLQGSASAGLIPSNNLSDVANPDASLANLRIGPGFVFEYYGSSLPTGYLWAAGQAVSRTTYANLFTALGTTYGVGDGSTTFNVPDKRGRVAVGRDNMNGSAANRVTSGGSGIAGTTLGANGGEETHTLLTAEIPSHTHVASAYKNQVGSSAGTAEKYNADGAGTTGPVANPLTGSTGGDGAHNNMQPSIVCNFIIKT